MSGNWTTPVPRWKHDVLLRFTIKNEHEQYAAGKLYEDCIASIEAICEYLDRICP